MWNVLTAEEREILPPLPPLFGSHSCREHGFDGGSGEPSGAPCFCGQPEEVAHHECSESVAQIRNL